MRTVFGIESLKLTAIDGSPSGRKEFLCWNTPFKDPKDPSSGRVDSTTESAKLFAQLILRGVKTIAFCRVRNVCELMIQAVRTELQHLEHGDVGGKVMAYRGGYTPEDRRRIEKEMFEGHLLGVVATNALELGVDIGSLDAVLIVNFPYSISNLRQQSGRAGRRNKDSLSVLIGGSFPIDQYYMSHPEEIFLKPNISLSIDLENLLILEGHIQCAAHEMPIEPTRDRQYFGEDLQSIASSRLVRDEAGFYHTHSRFKPYPPSHVAIRDTNDEPGYAVVDVTNNRNVVLEEVDPFRAIFTLYEGGIFLHQGRTYLVRTFSPESSLAQVEIVNVNWTTSPRDFTDVDPIETELIHIISNRSTKAFFGKIRITTVVFGFFKLDKRKRILDAVEMESPPLVRYAKGFWLDVPARALEILENAQMNAAAAIHAAEHAVMALLEGDGQGIKTECKAPEKEYMLKRESARKRPARLVFYDRNNADVSRKAFDFVKELLGRALDRVDNCRACISGCPECCCGARCGEGNVVVSKKGAAVVLKCLLGLEVKLGSLEGKDGRVIGEAERGWIAGRRTVVLASGVPGMKKDLVIKVEEEEAESRFINTVI
jgi:DEAD/DEAH box helicase domain-containing protein